MNLGQAYMNSSSKALNPSCLFNKNEVLFATASYMHWPSTRDFGILLTESFFRDIGDVIIQTHWEKRIADNEERVHAISSFVDLMNELKKT